MGDFNLDLLQAESRPRIGEFLNCLFSHYYFPTVHYPTRITETSATLLDNIFTNKVNNEINAGIVYSDISDHYPVLISVSLPLNKRAVNKFSTRRVFNSDSVLHFNEALQNVDWNNSLFTNGSQLDANLSFNIFMSIFNNLFNEHFPLKSVKLYRADMPRSDWITPGLIKSCNKKSLLYKCYKNNPTPENRSKYIRYRNKLKLLLKKAQKVFYSCKFKKYEGDLKKTWKLSWERH